MSQVKVIGAGFGRTGTASLKGALEELGFGPCYHMYEVFQNPGRADFWQAAWRGEPADWDAKVLLSVRNPERWYESTRQTIYELGRISAGPPFSRLGFALLSRLVFGRFKTGQGPMTEEIVWRGTFGGRFEDKDHAIEIFDRHNEEVRRRVPKEQLLVYEVKQGWGPLCEFLGVEEPEKPLPGLPPWRW